MEDDLDIRIKSKIKRIKRKGQLEDIISCRLLLPEGKWTGELVSEDTKGKRKWIKYTFEFCNEHDSISYHFFNRVRPLLDSPHSFSIATDYPPYPVERVDNSSLLSNDVQHKSSKEVMENNVPKKEDEKSMKGDVYVSDSCLSGCYKNADDIPPKAAKQKSRSITASH